jgi:CRP-like cAMP-binding protein
VSAVDVQDAIKNTPLFSQLSKKDVKQLAATLTQRTFPAGSVIIEKDKPGVGFFVIASGSAAVTLEGNSVRTLKTGDHFGEVALIDDGPRMAEVTAETDVECYVLAAWQFRPFVQDHPDVAWALLQSLVKRIVRDAGPQDEL